MMALLGSIFGRSGGLPHFSDIALGSLELLWALPLVAIGAVAGWLYFPFGTLARKLSALMGNHVIVKPALAGLVLGALGVALPFVLFAGEAQTEELSLTWTTIGAGTPHRDGLRQGVRNAALPEHGLARRPFLPHHLRGHRNWVRYGSPHRRRPGVRALRRDRGTHRHRHAPAHP